MQESCEQRRMLGDGGSGFKMSEDWPQGRRINQRHCRPSEGTPAVGKNSKFWRVFRHC